MKSDYKILLQAVLYAAVGVFLCTTLAILIFRYAIWLWNVFPDKTPPAIEITQKQKDDMCVAWWFDSDLSEAKKRACKK
jgi:hypothetical protein